MLKAMFVSDDANVYCVGQINIPNNKIIKHTSVLYIKLQLDVVMFPESYHYHEYNCNKYKYRATDTVGHRYPMLNESGYQYTYTLWKGFVHVPGSGLIMFVACGTHLFAFIRNRAHARNHRHLPTALCIHSSNTPPHACHVISTRTSFVLKQLLAERQRFVYTKHSDRLSVFARSK